ncbi:MAG: hypothetical protein A2075_20680 [Geobacteraceae bacterium GWC2_58_44]|nr:MAG: hypothetical protein A2075_20680 [Geobacteraceae bacterium GWC2_58_44]HBG05305.1 hypothetical protein [Geobacter sp.]
MNIQKYAKADIAFNQIETALRLLFEEGDLFSVITLAGAAEEILGQILQHKAGKGGFLKSVWEILRPGKRKEPTKEGDAGQETEAFVHMDLNQEAQFLLGRAIDDYQTLSGMLSANMLRFNKELREKKELLA